jgi:hypothetical protein
VLHGVSKYGFVLYTILKALIKIEFCIRNSNIGFFDYSVVKIMYLFGFIYLSL